MKKLLYIDVPFAGMKGGDKNRSNYIWQTLCREYDVDLLLINTPEFAKAAIPAHSGFDQLYHINTTESLPHMPAAIYSFSQDQKRKYTEILDRRRYEVIVVRFLSGFTLARIAAGKLPDCKIVIDVDMLFSRISELSWSNDRSLKNRYHLLEMLKLKAFEAIAFQYGFSFYFTNSFERDLAISRYRLKPYNALLFPNMMPEIVDEPGEIQEAEHKYILFFGTLNSTANQDAFTYLAGEIYPRISKKMQDKDLYLYIAGKNPTTLHKQYGGVRIKILGEVDDINALIANALFVVLPLRIASGTRTRILEAAALKKAVVTTSIGAEGFDFSGQAIALHDSADGFAKCITELIQYPDKAKRMGETLYDEAIARYSSEVVSRSFLDSLEEKTTENIATHSHKRLKLAIISNRFYPEVGGAETNIFYQARKLAEKHDVTVICPKRIKKPRLEKVDGITILRMTDIFNIPPKYPNLKAKTLCLEIFFHLLMSDYDIVQCFPALNYNNIAAYVAAKLKGIPYILCFFDFVDYAAIIKAEGRINPDLLNGIKPSLNQRFVLKGMDYAFAIAEKEISFIRKFNPRIEYSPVPILLEEYESEVENPRGDLGIPETDFVFLCLGRVSHIKGQDIALQAFIKAAQEMQGACLVFVGRTDYEAEFFEYLQSMITQNALKDRVFFTGVLERDKVLGWLRYSDIHVIPVRFMNSGAVVVESWISDTAVLQSNVVDPNLVIEDYNGYLFPSEDVGKLAEKMILAYSNRHKLPKLAMNGKALVKSKYTYDYLIELYEKTYQRLLANV